MRLFITSLLLFVSLLSFSQKSGFDLGGDFTDDIIEIDRQEICANDTTYWIVVTINENSEVVTTFENSKNEIIDRPVDFKIGRCEYRPTECVESQEWTYGIDNTGTRFNDVADYVITLSDGSTLEFSQDGSSGSWTFQLQEWANNIQAAADAAGLAWLVEPRFVNDCDPEDISGSFQPRCNLNANPVPSGLPGAPSIPVASALSDGGMSWRYVNIQICPGQPVPTNAERITSRDFTANPYTLTTAGAVLGPIQKFFVCRDCGKEPVWYLEDGVTLASAGQIPFCSEPCGTLSLIDAPPDRDCKFEISIACDNNDSTNIVDFTNTITRRATICNGDQIAVDYFQEDPNDPSALITYTLIGDFVDCATGEKIELPTPECSQFESLGLLYVTGGDAEEGANLDYWQPSSLGGSAVGHDNVSNIFANDGSTFSHPNEPDTSIVIPTPSFSTGNNWNLLNYTSNAQTGGTDQLKISGYFNLPQDALIYDTNTNTGERGLIAIKQCCAGDLTVLSERTTDSNAADRFFFTAVPVPAGTHYYEIITSDLSAFQGVELSVSFDNGATTEVLKSYSEKPITVCYPVVKCEDTGALFNGETFDPVTITQYDTWHPIECKEISSEGVDLPLCNRYNICTSEFKNAWLVETKNIDGTIDITYEDETGTITEPSSWTIGECEPIPDANYRCYDKSVEETQFVATQTSADFIWDQGDTDLTNSFGFTASDVDGSGVDVTFSVDESDGLGSLFTTGGSNGTTNGDNGGSYQFRAAFNGQVDPNSRLRHVFDFSEPVVVTDFYIGDLDRTDSPDDANPTRWQDAARVYGLTSDGSIVDFNHIPGSDVTQDVNGFYSMPQDANEQATDEDQTNWLVVNSDSQAVVSMIIEYYRGSDGGWDSDEIGDPLYGVPNSSSRMQLGNMSFLTTEEEEVTVTSIESACVRYIDSEEVWRDAITSEQLTASQVSMLYRCEESGGALSSVSVNNFPLYITQRTSTCINDNPRYILDWSDGTKTVEPPLDGEDDWCNCDGGSTASAPVTLPTCPTLQTNFFNEQQFAWGFQVQNTGNAALSEWQYVVRGANYQIDASQLTNNADLTYSEVDNGDGTFDLYFNSTSPLAAFSSSNTYEWTGVDFGFNPTSASQELNCN